MTTVQQYRDLGFKVRVTHRRSAFLDINGLYTNELATRYEIEQHGANENTHGKYSASVLPCGGKTTVELTTPEGITTTGVAKCSDKDPYNRKVGLMIALGRAEKQLEDKNG